MILLCHEFQNEDGSFAGRRRQVVPTEPLTVIDKSTCGKWIKAMTAEGWITRVHTEDLEKFLH